MENSIIAVKAFQIKVSNLDKSIRFYESLGFVIVKRSIGQERIHISLALPPYTGIEICLCKRYINCEIEDPEFQLEIIANPDSGFFHDEVYTMLQDDGIEYANIKPEKRHQTICTLGEIIDPDGHTILLQDQFVEDYSFDEEE